MAKFVLNDLEDLMKNPHYKNYFSKKNKIKEKYDSEIISSNHLLKKDNDEYIKNIETNRKVYKEYISEILDLILVPNGDFQEFSRDMMGEIESEQQTRLARGRIRSYSSNRG